MSFIVNTLVYETDTGTQLAPNPIRPALRWRLPGQFETVEAALAEVPAIERPPRARYGAYELDYDVRCFMKVMTSGLDKATGHIVVEYDVWPSEVAQVAGDPPSYQNTHIFQVPTARGTDLRDYIQKHIFNQLIHASLRGWVDGPKRDGKDRRLRGARLTTNDPIWSDSGLTELRQKDLDIDTERDGEFRTRLARSR